MNLILGLKMIIGGVALLKVAQIVCDIIYNTRALRNIEDFRLRIYAKTNKLYTKQHIRNTLKERTRINFVEILVVLAIALVLILI